MAEMAACTSDVPRNSSSRSGKRKGRRVEGAETQTLAGTETSRGVEMGRGTDTDGDREVGG